MKKATDSMVSTCNLSDAMNRGGSLGEFHLVGKVEGLVTGKAVTCRTENGDWWAVVKAIDSAGKGDVIVIESLHGKDKAVVGELLATSAKRRGVAGFVVDGSVRDRSGLEELGLPIFARGMVVHAGNPERKGRIGVPVTVYGVRIKQGDVIAFDENGVVAVPKAKFKSVMSKAKEIVAKELQVRKKIGDGKSLSSILGF